MSSKLMCATLLILLLVTSGVPDDNKKEKKIVTLPKSGGIVARLSSTASPFSKNRDRKLNFCVFENGAHDLIYVGTSYGMWSDGEFDLSYKGKVIYTGKIKYLLYEGTIIDMGDVLDTTGDKNVEVVITRVVGWFK